MNTRHFFYASGSIRLIGMLIASFFAFDSLEVEAITLTGSNGRGAELLGIKDATPKGLTAQMVADGPIIGIPWAKLDLAALERDQKLVFAAYERAIAGETIALDLGSFAKAVAGKGGEKGAMPLFEGWVDTQAGGVTFAMQMPIGKPRGILIIGKGERGGSMNYLTSFGRGEGPWGKLTSKYDLILMGYDYDSSIFDPRKIDSFAYADKGSGVLTIKAISDLAVKTKQPELIDLPILLFGEGKVGASFVYHFALWKPELVLGAVMEKGGFYDAEPSEAAAKLPMVFIWGEYSKSFEIWENENSARHVLSKFSSIKPNWTSAMEFRGPEYSTPASQHFAQVGLEEIVELRLPARKPPPEPEPEPESEEKPEAGKAVEADSDSEEKEEEAVKEPTILPYDRSKGMVGNFKTEEVAKIADVDVELTEDETFIISGGLSLSWKQFLSGEFEVRGN